MSSDRTSREIIDSVFKLLCDYGETGAVHVALTAIESLKKHHERKPIQVIQPNKVLSVREHPLTQQQLADISQAGDIIANIPAETAFARSQLNQGNAAIQNTLKRLNPKQVFCIIDTNTGQYVKEQPISKEQEEIEKLKVANDELKKLRLENEAKDKLELAELKKQLDELKELRKLKEELEASNKENKDKKSLTTTSTDVPVLTKETKEVTKDKEKK